MRIVAIGRTRILYDSINILAEAGHEIVLIGTCKAAPEYDIKEDSFESLANKLGAKFFNDIHINSPYIVDLLRSVKADIAVSINWITIIRDVVLNCFKYGVLNAHAGDLPRYRGNACPNWAILKGENEYAITIHYMKGGELDSGDILLKKYYEIYDNTSITDIYFQMGKEIPLMFVEAIEKINWDGFCAEKQSTDPNDSLRCYPRIPTDSYIDFNDSCMEILRNIRASSHPFQGSFFFLDSNKVYVYEAEWNPFYTPCYVYPGQVIEVNRDDGYVCIAARDGMIKVHKLCIDKIEYVASDILNSTRIRVNYCLPEEIYIHKKKMQELMDEIDNIKKKLSGVEGND